MDSITSKSRKATLAEQFIFSLKVEDRHNIPFYFIFLLFLILFSNFNVKAPVNYGGEGGTGAETGSQE